MPGKAGEGGFTGDEGLCFCCPRDEMTELAEGGDFETVGPLQVYFLSVGLENSSFSGV